MTVPRKGYDKTIQLLYQIQNQQVIKHQALDYQLAMPGLFKVMKYIWHEEPPLADEKNTCTNQNQTVSINLYLTKKSNSTHKYTKESSYLVIPFT